MYDNHRCITIGSMVSKVFSMLIDKRLTRYLEDNGLVRSTDIRVAFALAGGQQSRSSSSITLWRQPSTHTSQTVHCAFVDFRKAFDTVRHSHLWERLQAYGITSNVLACIIQSLYAQSAVSVIKRQRPVHRLCQGDDWGTAG